MGLFYDEYNKAKAELQKLSDEIGDTKNPEREVHKYSFRLWKENQLMGLLALIKESGFNAVLNIETAAEAKLLIDGLAAFAENRKKLVNAATEIYLFCEKTRKLNEFVRNNVFLGDENIRPEYHDAFLNAKTYLEVAPLFSKYYTNEAILFIWQNLVAGLSRPEMVKLMDTTCLPADLISQLEFSGDQHYLNNLLFVREKLGLPLPMVETLDTKLKGVTFTNDDKSDRQEYLKQLQTAFKKCPQELTIEQWEYKGEPAAKVFWGSKEIGAIPADLMKELSEKYAGFELAAEIVKVSGGDNFNYGCEIKLHVFGEQKSNIKISDFFKQKQAREVEEPMKEKSEEDKGDRADDISEELDFE